MIGKMEHNLAESKNHVSYYPTVNLNEIQSQLQDDQVNLTPKIQNCVQETEELIKDKKCPKILGDELSFMESKWSDYCQALNKRIAQLTRLSMAWDEFSQQQKQLIHVLDDADDQLKSQTIEENLTSLKCSKEKVEKEAENLLLRIKQLSDILIEDAAVENKISVENQVYKMTFKQYIYAW